MRFENLEVYKKSYELSLSIYRFTQTIPNEEKFGIISQLKRASLSIPLNIAEGYGKQAGETEFKRFLAMSKGSCNEVAVLLSFCKDLGLLSEEDEKIYQKEYEIVEKMIYSLMKKN